jgi:NADH-quinone oxidoreductase subunit C
MTGKEIYDKLKTAFGKSIGEWNEQTSSEYQKRTSSYVDVVETGYLRDVCLYLRDDAELAFDNLNLVSTLDNGDKTLSSVYHMESLSKKQNFALKVTVSLENPVVPSVTSVWASANWHEREGYDMMGITFLDHPDHRRILLDDDWIGHPLRKDYKQPDFYRGMKVPY